MSVRTVIIDSMTRLNDLPAHRRHALLWRLALRDDWEAVDGAVAAAAGQECSKVGLARALNPPVRSISAELGDDGTYHLVVNGSPRCGTFDAENVGGTAWEHWAPWDPNTQARPIYEVRPVGTVRDPFLVPAKERCPSRARGSWPPFCDPKSRLGRLRITLVDQFGPGCQCCGGGLGMIIDHDHFSEVVRGLVCRVCNSGIDFCPHLDECAFGRYLNDPPAAHLNLQYPMRPRENQRSTKRKTIELLGVNPFGDPSALSDDLFKRPRALPHRELLNAARIQSDSSNAR